MFNTFGERHANSASQISRHVYLDWFAFKMYVKNFGTSFWASFVNWYVKEKKKEGKPPTAFPFPKHRNTFGIIIIIIIIFLVSFT